MVEMSDTKAVFLLLLVNFIHGWSFLRYPMKKKSISNLNKQIFRDTQIQEFIISKLQFFGGQEYFCEFNFNEIFYV